MAEISYTKTNWVNNVTKLNADNMNHIENGIETLYTAFGTKLDKSDVVQTTGQSTTEVMSQKAVTDELNGKANKADLEQTSAKLDALWKLNEGISYDFVTVNAWRYEISIPSGAKKAAIEMISGGRQQVDYNYFVKADVKSVKVRGTNMFDEDLLLTATGWTKENGVYKGIANYIMAPNIFSSLVFELNTQYYISYNVTQIDATNFRLLVKYTDNTTSTITGSGITNERKTVSKIQFEYETNGTIELSNIIVAKSSVAVDYAPYHIETYPIPQAVRNLEGYGWGESYNPSWERSFTNYIERTESGWQYVQEANFYVTGEVYPITADFVPNITDISNLMTGFPNNFNVEPGGVIIFEIEKDENYEDIPTSSSGSNTVKYLRALAEVK